MGNEFDLETAIMEAWITVEDLDLIYNGIEDYQWSHTDYDKLQNQLLGLKHIVDLRFQKLWDVARKRIEEDKFEKVTRVEVIDGNGRSYVCHGAANLELSLQDDNRTLKLFITEKEERPGVWKNWKGETL